MGTEKSYRDLVMESRQNQSGGFVAQGQTASGNQAEPKSYATLVRESRLRSDRDAEVNGDYVNLYLADYSNFYGGYNDDKYEYTKRYDQAVDNFSWRGQKIRDWLQLNQESLDPEYFAWATKTMDEIDLYGGQLALQHGLRGYTDWYNTSVNNLNEMDWATGVGAAHMLESEMGNWNEQKEDFLLWLDENKDWVGPEYYKWATEQLGNISDYNKELTSGYQAKQDYFRQWETQEDYDHYQYLLNLDTDQMLEDIKQKEWELEGYNNLYGGKVGAGILMANNSILEPGGYFRYRKDIEDRESELNTMRVDLRDALALQDQMHENEWTQKYAGLTYDELVPMINRLEPGKEREWLESYAPSTMTVRDRAEQKAQNNTELYWLEKFVEEWEVILDREYGLDAEYGMKLENDKKEIMDRYAEHGIYSFEDAMKRIEELKKENWELDRITQYGAIPQLPGFEAGSAVPQGYQGGSGSVVSMFDYINDINGARQRERDRIAGYGESPYAIYDYMDDQQIAVYNYLVNTEGSDSAQEYLDYISYELNSRRNQAVTQGAAELASGLTDMHLGFLADAMSVPTNMLSGAGFIDVGFQHLGRALSGEYRPIDYNRGAMDANSFTQGVRQTRALHFNEMGMIELDEREHPILARALNGKGLGDIYQLGMSLVDSAVIGRIGKILGTSNVTLLLSGSAATNGVLEALERGASDEQALLMGALNGMTEWLFEKYELENLLGQDDSYIKAVVNQALTEGFGEAGTTWGNILADTLIMGKNNSTFTAAENYMQTMGYDPVDAFKRAIGDQLIEAAWDFIGGLVTGGIMGGGNQIVINATRSDTARATSKRLQTLGDSKFVADQKADELEIRSEAYGAEGKYFTENYDPKQEIGEYDLEFRTAYEMGKAGADKAKLESNDSFKTMSQSQRDIAYDAGVEARKRAAAKERKPVKAAYEVSDNQKVIEIESGKEVTIQGFTKVGNQPQLDIGGKSVAADGISYASAEDAALYETIGKVAGSASTANSMLAQYQKSGVSAADFASGLQEAYDAGMNASAAKTELKNMEFAGKIPYGVAAVAYDRGADRGKYRAAARESTIKARGAQQKGERREGKLHFDRKGRTFDSVREKSLAAMESISRALGVDIYVFESFEKDGKRVYVNEKGETVTAPNGWYDPETGSIHIDLNAGNTGRGTMMFTLAHELTHFIKQWSPVKFRILTDALLRGYSGMGQSVNALVEKQMAKAAANGRTLTEEAALEEVVADSMESMLVSGEFGKVLSEIQSRDKTLWQKIRDWFQDVAKKLKEAADAFRNAAPDSVEGRMVQQMDEMYAELQKLFAEGLVEASGNYAAAEGQKNTTREGGVKYQARAGGYDYSKPFSEQVDDWLKQDGTFPQIDTLLVGATPKVLRDIGIPAIPVTIAQKNLRENLLGQYKGTAEEIADHAISPEEMKKLPEKLADPVAIIVDRRQVRNKWSISESAVDVLVEMQINGKDAIVPVRISGNAVQQGAGIDSNVVSSIHGNRDALSRLKYAMDNDSPDSIHVFYANKNKTTAYLRKAGYTITSWPNISDGVNHSITDPGSPVQLRVASTIATRQFKNWFGKSKIVNPDKTPKVMYHGSHAQFDTFDRKKAKSSGTFGKGFYFTDSTTHAGQYGNLYAVYLSIQNPLQAGKANVTRAQVRAFLEAVADNEDYSIENYGTYDIDKILRNVMGGNSKADAFRVIQDISVTAIGDTVDAAELFNQVNGTDFDGIVTPMETVAFQPTQIKSATDNVGTFDKGNPNIYYSGRDASLAELSQEQIDLEYFSAVNRGDMATAQRMVDEAAKRWGAFLNNAEANEVFKQNGEVRIFYHGTNTGDFTVFYKSLLGSSSGDMGWFGKGFYFAFSAKEAKYYGGRVINAYLKMQNPYDYSQLYKFKGSNYVSDRYAIFAWLYNVVKQFPDIVDGQKVYAYPNDAEDGSVVTWKQLARWMDGIEEKAQFSVEQVETPYGEIAWELRANPKQESFTNDDGETFTWTEYGMRQLFSTEREAREPINQIGAYLANVMGVESIPRRSIEKIDFSGAVQRAGYDGIIQSPSGDEAVVFDPNQIKSAEAVTYDDAGNVIPLSKRFSTENPDIRFSDRDPTAAATAAELEKQNAVLRGDVEELKELLRLQGTVTGGRIPKKSSVEAAAKWLKGYAGATMNADDMRELTGMLTEFYSFIANDEELAWESVMEKAAPIADFIQSRVNVKPQMSEYAKDVLKELRGRKISLSDSQRAEVEKAYGSYNEYRKAAFGNVTLTKDGDPMDSVWQEMSSLFPGTFDEETSAGNQPMELLEVIRKLRSTDTADMEYAYNREFIRADIMRAVYDSYWRVSSLKTVADKAQKQINEIKARHRQQMEDLRNEKNRAIETIRQQRKTELEQIRKSHRQEIRDRITATEKRYQESRERATEKRRHTATKNSLKKLIGEIRGLYENGTKERNVKKGMRNFVEQALATAEVLFMENYTDEDIVLAGVDLPMNDNERRLMDETQELIRQRNDVFKGGVAERSMNRAEAGDIAGVDALTERYEKLNRRIRQNMRRLERIIKLQRAMLNRTTVTSVLEGLAQAYRELAQSDDNFIKNGVYENVFQGIRDLITELQGTTVQDMTSTQLMAVEKAFRQVLHTIRQANKSFVAGKAASIAERGDAAASEVRAVGGFRFDRATGLDPARKFWWNNLKPVYAMERIGSKTLKDAYNEIRKGEDVWARDVNEAREFFQQAADKYGYDSWDQDTQHTFKTPNGQEFQLTLGQMMSIYAYSKRADAKDHLRIGGIVYDPNQEVYREKNGKKSRIKRSLNDATAYQIGEGTVAAILETMTEEQVAFVDEMQTYLSETMGAKGNEVSNVLYGVDLFGEKNYFPMKSARQFFFEQNQPTGEVSLKNSGFTKPIQPGANNPLVLGSFMDVWAKHVNQMSTYHGFALPIEDFNRIFNYQTGRTEERAPKSVKAAIQGAYSPAATEYISRMLTDINGGARMDPAAGVISRMMSLFKKGAVFASLSVTFQQPSAIGRAAALIDPKYFAGKRIEPKKLDKLWAECKEYAPVALIKEMGFFDTSVGKSTQDYITQRSYSGLQGILKGLATDSGYRDELMGKLPAWADMVTWAAIWDAVKREQHALNPDADTAGAEFLQMCGERFTEIITKTQVYDSVLSRSANMRSKDTGMQMLTVFMAEPTTSMNMLSDAAVQAKRGVKGYPARAVGSVIAAQIINSILVSFVYAARDDDKEMTYWEKYLKSLSDNIWNDVFLMVPNSIPFISDIMSMLQGYDVERSDMAIISDMINAIQKLGDAKTTPWKKVELFAGAVAQIFGFPLKNIIRDIKGFWNVGNHIQSTVSGTLYGYEWNPVDKAMELKEYTRPTPTASGILYAIREGITGETVSRSRQLYEARVSGDTAHIARMEALYPNAESANAAVKNVIKEMFMTGEIDQSDAEMQLFDYAGLQIHEAWWTVDSWIYQKDKGYSDGYSKYNDMYSSMLEGGDITELMKEFTDHGYREEDVLTNLKKEVGKWYYDDESETRIDRDQAERMLESYFDLDEEEIADQLRKWDMKLETGFSYNDLKEEFLKNNVSEKEAIAMLKKYGGLYENEASDKVNAWIFEKDNGFAYSDMRDMYLEGTISERDARTHLSGYGKKDGEEVDYTIRLWNFEKEHGWAYEDRVSLYKNGGLSRADLESALKKFGGYSAEDAKTQIEVYDWEMDGYKNVTINRVEKWHEYCEPLGIGKEIFLDLQRYSYNTKNDVDPETGKSINYSAMKKVMAYIDSLPLTDQQKDAMAYSLGWSKKNIEKYKPW